MRESSLGRFKETMLTKEEGFPNWEGKSQFLLFMGDFDYVKGKVNQCFMMQLLGMELKRPSEKMQVGNEYHLVQRRKRTKEVILS